MDADKDIVIVGVCDLYTPFEIGDLLLSERLRVTVIDRDILVADLFDSATAKAQDIRDSKENMTADAVIRRMW